MMDLLARLLLIAGFAAVLLFYPRHGGNATAIKCALLALWIIVILAAGHPEHVYDVPVWP